MSRNSDPVSPIFNPDDDGGFGSPPLTNSRGSYGGTMDTMPTPTHPISGLDPGAPHFGRGAGGPAHSGPGTSVRGDMEEEEYDDSASQTLVWGTNINVSRLQKRIWDFLTTYQDVGTQEPKYTHLIAQMLLDEQWVLDVDCQNVYNHDTRLYDQLLSFPQEVIPLMDTALKLVATEHNPEIDEDFKEKLQIRVYNVRESTVIRDLNPSDLDRLVSVSGMVTRTSTIIPDLRTALLKCERCGYEHAAPNDKGRVQEPPKCPNVECNASWTMKIIHNRSIFNNRQLVKLQENPNAIPEGETPHAVSLFAYDELVDMAKPGARVTITGVYKAQPMRVSPKLRMVKCIYKTYIDVVHIACNEKSKLAFTVANGAAAAAQGGDQEADAAAEPMAVEDSKESLEQKVAEFQALAAHPDIYNRLVNSLAPSIWQMQDVKRGILCQLFGGTTKEFSGGRVRGELNVLLVGDPGVSKSQLLTYVHKLAPRGMYTSGRGSSAVGLTAYVSRDPETKEMVLESGALVLSDQGVCCIDEFDKMSDSARSMLHEVMEQQTVSVAKAGIISQLNARTSVLASANPVGSRYNPHMSVIDNIQLPPTLLSRFDLIYLVLDKADTATDRKLARHLIGLYYENQPQQAQAMIPMQQLRDYIAYAREHCKPALSDAAAQCLVEEYVAMRRMGASRKVIAATPRQLESLIRLSEALARMRLSETVETFDVAEALRLMKVAMQQSATDPVTGVIDMDIIQTGVSAFDRTAANQLAGEAKTVINRSDGWLTFQSLLETLNAQSSMPLTFTHLQHALEIIGNETIVDWNRKQVKRRL